MSLPIRICKPPQNILHTRLNPPPKVLNQPVFLEPIRLSAVILPPTPRPPGHAYPEETPRSPCMQRLTLPCPQLPAFQIFAPPLTLNQLPCTSLKAHCLPQTPSQWTRAPQSHQPQQLLSPFPSPQVPQTGFVSQTCLPVECLPKPPPLFRPIQPPNSTPDFESWG